jgi:predicted RNase H-like HicB family nuclease
MRKMGVQRRMKMRYQALVENLPNGQFSASVIGFSDIVAEGATLEEALSKVRAPLEERLAAGRLFTIEAEDAPMVTATNPWIETHGSLRDDPAFDDWVEEIAKYRRECDDRERRQ